MLQQHTTVVATSVWLSSFLPLGALENVTTANPIASATRNKNVPKNRLPTPAMACFAVGWHCCKLGDALTIAGVVLGRWLHLVANTALVNKNGVLQSSVTVVKTYTATGVGGGISPVAPSNSGTSVLGMNSRRTPSLSMMAKRMHPPLEPSRPIASATARVTNDRHSASVMPCFQCLSQNP